MCCERQVETGQLRQASENDKSKVLVQAASGSITPARLDQWGSGSGISPLPGHRRDARLLESAHDTVSYSWRFAYHSGRRNTKGAGVRRQEGVMQGRQGTRLVPSVHSHPHKPHCA